MKYLIRHESSCSIRLHMAVCVMSMDEADILEYYLKDLEYVLSAKVYDRTGDIIVRYESSMRGRLLKALDRFRFDDEKAVALVPENTGRALNRVYQDKMVWTVAGRYLRKLFIPAPVRRVITVIKSIRFIYKGIRCLLSGRIEVPVLDATAIAVSMIRGDFETASSVMFLLRMGDLLEEWTHKKSIGDLARTMALDVDTVWLKTDGPDVQADLRDVKEGDRIVVRTSDIIPLDGKVVSGEAAVNQSSMTGESVPVVKESGGYVYAGTVVEEGECVIEVAKTSGAGRYDQIVKMIEASEKLKSTTEAKAYHLADALVPYSLGGTVLTWLITRNASKALSFLMVDFSCALKLSMPLAVLSAIREARQYDISVKGAKFLEAVAEADTIVFDKTGTLTRAVPKVERVVVFDDLDENEALKVAACLEEHFPHSVANAVTTEAVRRGIEHEEMHAEVNYVVAHGISSTINGKKSVIGSWHFVFEDEKCVLRVKDKKKLEKIPAEYTTLYLAIDKKLKAVICISDPLRDEAREVIDELHGLGFSKICMMTGDNERTADSVASKLNLDDHFAEVLPEDKASFVKKERENGHKVIMIGDGVNDAPALSEADVGIAISDGAAIAREIADITIASNDLRGLITLRRLAAALMQRINGNYRMIISFNAALIALGVLGVLPPATSALLHNSSTIAAGLKSMTDLLP